MDHYTHRAGADVLLMKNGKILLLRRANTGWADGMLVLPGGHIEAGETARQAAAREVNEELGMTIDQDRLVFYTTAMVRTNHDYVCQEFYVNLRGGERPVNKEPDKHSGFVWCDPGDLPDDVQEVFQTIITQGYVNQRRYLEIGY